MSKRKPSACNDELIKLFLSAKAVQKKTNEQIALQARLPESRIQRLLSAHRCGSYSVDDIRSLCRAFGIAEQKAFATLIYTK